jgi:prolyl 4-hydroxylase
MAAITFKAIILCLLLVGKEVVLVVTAEQSVASSSESESSVPLPTCENDDQEHNSPNASSPKSLVATAATSYTHRDDASWAIVSPNLSCPHKQAVYDDFIEGCKIAAGGHAFSVCELDEMNRLQMNANQPSAMRNFTKQGFVKLRAPDEVMTLLQDYFNKHQQDATEEWEWYTPYHNSWVSPPTILRLEHAMKHGYGGGASGNDEQMSLPNMIARYVQNAIQEWTGQKQRMTSVYGIRLYHNQSILTPHVDRLPLVSSCIINVAQDVDEEWPLEVYDHDGVAHNVTMQPGDMVLYESHSVIHGRPFPLNGKYFANVFVHFEPMGSLLEKEGDDDDDDEKESSEDNNEQRNGDDEQSGDESGDDDLPYYIIPGTPWAQKYAAERNRA